MKEVVQRKGKVASPQVILGIAALGLAVGGWLWMRPGEEEAKPVAVPLEETDLEARRMKVEEAGEVLSPPLAAALGYAGDLPSPARVRELLNLRQKELSQEESEELLRGLLTFPEKGTSAAQHSTWFHEAANVLHRQKVPARTFAEVLATVARGGKRSLATRDYALQHLRRVWEREEPHSELRGAIEATFAEFAGAENELRATALLSLHLIDPKGRQVTDPARLAEMVMAALAAEDRGSERGIRVTMVACRIAGERKMEESREALLGLASSDREHAMVRMAAIAALGRQGRAEDLRKLASLQADDPRVAQALRRVTETSPPP